MPTQEEDTYYTDTTKTVGTTQYIQLKTGETIKVWTYIVDSGYGCDNCCNGDRCEDRTHIAREDCTHCQGMGWILDDAVNMQVTQRLGRRTQENHKR